MAPGFFKKKNLYCLADWQGNHKQKVQSASLISSGEIYRKGEAYICL
jgi:hypothetical protein